MKRKIRKNKISNWLYFTVTAIIGITLGEIHCWIFGDKITVITIMAAILAAYCTSAFIFDYLENK